MPGDLCEKTICDFGAGTGIVGIAGVLNGSTDVVFLEDFDEYLEICQSNVHTNLSSTSDLSVFVGKTCPVEKRFDYIFCNPASLPSYVGNDPFFDGGEHGLDMINEAMCFSRRHLKRDGRLYLLITSILPLNMVKNNITSHGFEYEVAGKTRIPFRHHYQGIAEWVNKNNAATGYEGGYYIKRPQGYYEEVQLFIMVKS